MEIIRREWRERKKQIQERVDKMKRIRRNRREHK